jgi:hypothetical protein
LLVVGHGTASVVGAEEARGVATLVAGMLPDVPVELGYLEVIEPTIAEAVAQLAARGCRELVAAPLLLVLGVVLGEAEGRQEAVAAELPLPTPPPPPPPPPPLPAV